MGGFCRFKENIYISSQSCGLPPGFGVRRIGQGACTGQPPLSSSIKTARSPLARPSFSSILSQHLQRSVAWSHHAQSTPLAQTHPQGPFVGLAAAENPRERARLKLESSIYLSRFDAEMSATAIIPLDHVVLAEIRAVRS
jgi:hypothetical protein